MGLFGRSNKKKSRPSPPQYGYESSIELPRQPNSTTRPNLYYVEERPRISNGYNQGQPTPQGWIVAQIEPAPPRYQPHTTVAPPPLPPRAQRNGVAMMNFRSVTNLLTETSRNDLPCMTAINNGVAIMSQQTMHHYHQTSALYDTLSLKLCSVVTSIDEERFSGDDRELTVPQHYDPALQEEKSLETTNRDLMLRSKKSKVNVKDGKSAETTYTNYFSKVHDYANSRLPMDLKPMRLYFNTYPLICLAAQYSEQVYSKPTGQEKETRVNAGGRAGTVMKSVPIDDKDVIVFAIRGTTHSFTDWAVNVKTKPASPQGFLDDPGNLCHSGFLGAAKDWIKPIAARLRNLLQENPKRTQCSLLITGHSAGGAIAALLYSHMLSTSREAKSELNVLAGYFKRIHCVTFGAPPISLLPLQKPKTASKSIFMSFVNEGDLVARADFAYVKSLLDLYSTPAPGKSVLPPSKLGIKSTKSTNAFFTPKNKKKKKHSKTDPNISLIGPIWHVPEATLSNAGSIILLRGVDRDGNPEGSKKIQDRLDDGVIAQIISDELLRGVVWGDPVSHMMRLYARRIEVLATNAVMGRV
ncbi:a3fa0e21-df68-48df-9276-036719a731d2 [Sclerotinia trifoliorum]|uniref:A3fa0e21-df68-48df-9276-036719a731d2 n=1 Tax=Sclerotinia trifoliorum TaxID=28548 RepID=A0A8H2VUH4_9HELO|nr:a3fa0e21-df68-48df-9276-036719a731d2 [Sclerotinia trifoliorum]